MPRSEPGLLVMCFNMATMLTTLLAHGQVLLVALGSPVVLLRNRLPIIVYHIETHLGIEPFSATIACLPRHPFERVKCVLIWSIR